ncbi:hypothetical protein [Rhizobium halophytocola]|uniref:Uncharacterized protein n=1 Tax=Rhizobium halophytocola TaxID=735519 RepID=A0ABS4E5N5_9HYPH|nr:hypothetical protein [Rhizobium halophytocola]MBP1853261.1 hypothetical protein [Rhizobium halophytocola]
MSSLASTTWKFDVPNSGTVVWTFNQDATASALGRQVGRWVEDDNGNFIIELNGQNPGGYKSVWAGRHADGNGQGVSSPIFNNATFSFTMAKQPGMTEADGDFDPVELGLAS